MKEIRAWLVKQFERENKNGVTDIVPIKVGWDVKKQMEHQDNYFAMHGKYSIPNRWSKIYEKQFGKKTLSTDVFS